jgi:hypothetical protein
MRISTKDLVAETNSLAEQSYDRLEGDWLDWYKTAKTYEHKVEYQDRQDIRHDIIAELHRARVRDGKPLPKLRQYRIASLMVALYWRQRTSHSVKVCLYNGIAEAPHCGDCQRKPNAGICQWQGSRPPQSIEQLNEAGHFETIADDHALDLDAWVDARVWRLGCPLRLIEIGNKKRDGKPLDKKDQKYLERYLKKAQKSLF